MEHRLQRLIAYSAGAGAFLLLGNETDAQLVYHHLDPDTIIDYDQEFALDFNDDGVNDIVFTGWYSSWETWTSSTHSYYRHQIFYIKSFDAVINDPEYPSSFGAKNLSSGNIISSAASWNVEEEIKIARFYKQENGWYSDNTDFNSYYNNWVGNAQYLGVRFQIDGATHYGWVRLSVDDMSRSEYDIPKLIIQDYGYEATPEATLIIQNPAASIATNLLLLDAGESETANDLRLSFTKAAHEETVSAYRIYLYPYSYPEFPGPPTIDSLLSLPPERYTEILPDGADVAFYFNEFTQDIAGNTILTGYGEQYKAIVLSVADGVITILHNVSLQSNADQIVIRNAMRAEYIGTLNPGNSGTTADFEVSFQRAYDEFGILEYRAYLMNVNDEFEAEYLEDLDNLYYAAVSPDGSESYVAAFTSSKQVVGEVTPELFGRYTSIVISISDGVITSANNDNNDDGYTTFFYSPYQEAPVVFKDGVTGSPADWLVEFNQLKYESYMDEYRLFLVPADEYDLFTQAMAYDADESSFTKVLPIGEHIHQHLKADMNDCFGDPVDVSTSYVVVVAMVMSSTMTSLSLPSAPVNFTVGIHDEMIKPGMVMIENTLALSAIPNDASLHIFNMAGETVCSELLLTGDAVVNLHNLPAGIYVAELQYDNCKQVVKISIQ